jgi:hypothetical protein
MIAKLATYALGLSLLLHSYTAIANGNCPAGYYESSGGGVSGCIAYPTASGQPPDPGPQWSTRWGAIATATGTFGTANNLSSKRKAQKEAMKRCKAQGGKDCSVLLSFYNQCGALVGGDTRTLAYGDAELAKAESGAMANCSAATQNCKLYYSACSYPERIR